MARQGLTAYLDAEAASGRNGDTELAHFSRDELDILDSLQGGPSINPYTGRREYFKFGKVLKSVAKAAGALAGGYFGGPVGAAIGGGAVSKLMGDSTSQALTTGLLSGLGAWGAQSSGLGDMVGGGFQSGAGWLGQDAADVGMQTASAMADSVASGGEGGGFSLSSALPFLGLGAAALGAGSYDAPKSSSGSIAADNSEPVEYEPLDRNGIGYDGDPYSYGVFSPEFQFFDDVNPSLQPLEAAAGGRVHMAEGGIGNDGRERTDRGNESKGGNGGGGSGGSDDRREAIADRRSSQANANATAQSRGGISDRERAAYEQYSKSMQQGNMANLAGPHGYMSAADRYRTEHPENELDRWDVLDFIGGPFIDAKPPDVTNPDSYAGGDWHTSTNVGGAVGTGLGLGLGFPGLGQVGSWIDNQLGIPDIYHGGPGYVSDMAREYQDSLGGNNSGGAPQGGGSGNGNMGQIGSIVQAAASGAASPTSPGSGPGPADQPSDGSAPTGRTFKPLSDPYTYGQFGPEHTFFVDELNMRGGGNVKGPGTGQSDDIPAMLARDEHVIDADTVAMLGDGSSDAGHARIEEFKKAIRAHKRGAKPNAIPPKAKSITEYMRGIAA